MDSFYRGTYYKYDKRPRVISPNGDEEYPADPELWSLFEEVERAKKETSGTHLHDDQIQQTPQKIIDKLFAARGELDVIHDVIAGLEHQQAMAVTHSSHQLDQEELEHHKRVKSARRLYALGQGIDRLRFCVGSMRESKANDDQYLEELLTLRKKWNLQRRERSHGGGFYIDMSVKLLLPWRVVCEKSKNKSTLTSSSLAKLQQQRRWELQASYDIYPDPHDGLVCLHQTQTDDTQNNTNQSICKGVDAVDKELHRKYLILVWNALQKFVAMEAKAQLQPSESENGIDNHKCDECEVATHQLLSSSAFFEDRNESSGLKDRPRYCFHNPRVTHGTQDAISVEELQPRFRSFALAKMANLMEAAEVPALVADTPHHSGRDGIYDDLVDWVHQSIMVAQISQCLARQAEELRSAGHQVVIERVTEIVGDSVMSHQKWQVKVDQHHVLGSIVLAQPAYPSKLRWVSGGPPLRGLPSCFGIGKLDGILALAVAKHTVSTNCNS